MPFFFLYSRNAKKLLFSQNRTKKKSIKTIEKKNMSNLYRMLNNKLRKNTSDIISIKLIEFYEDMKKLETDPEQGGKQATLILQTTNDIELLKK